MKIEVSGKIGAEKVAEFLEGQEELGYDYDEPNPQPTDFGDIFSVGPPDEEEFEEYGGAITGEDAAEYVRYLKGLEEDDVTQPPEETPPMPREPPFSFRLTLQYTDVNPRGWDYQDGENPADQYSDDVAVWNESELPEDPSRDELLDEGEENLVVEADAEGKVSYKIEVTGQMPQTREEGFTLSEQFMKFYGKAGFDVGPEYMREAADEFGLEFPL
jgi:hypothetical protein